MEEEIKVIKKNDIWELSNLPKGHEVKKNAKGGEKIQIKVAQMSWRIFQLDVESAFLNGYLERNVYVEQPMSFTIKGQEEKVLKLKKALYSLNQPPMEWNRHIDKYFQDNGLISYYLGLEVKQMNNSNFVSQESYAKKMFEKFKMFDCNFVNTLMQGSLKLSKFDSGEKEDLTLLKSLVGSLRMAKVTQLNNSLLLELLKKLILIKYSL
ncbi:hypothetical protein CR513_32985, partial [Mucuna pruriens]